MRIMDHFRPNESVISPDASDPKGNRRYSTLPIQDASSAVIVRNSLRLFSLSIPVTAGMTIVGITRTKPVSIECRLWADAATSYTNIFKYHKWILPIECRCFSNVGVNIWILIQLTCEKILLNALTLPTDSKFLVVGSMISSKIIILFNHLITEWNKHD